MNFPCPKCNTPDKGVLLFNLVAPCDSCSGIVPEKKKEKYTIEFHKDLHKLGKFIQVAVSCGKNREAIQQRIDNNYSWLWTSYEVYESDSWFIQRPDDLCVVQWSE